MKVIFLTAHTRQASARYRFLQFIPYLKRNGLSCAVKELPLSFGGRSRLYRELGAYDVVFLQKRLLSAIDLYQLKRRSARLVYDFDDAVMFRESSRDRPRSLKRMARFRRTVKVSDAVIAGNGYLKTLAEPYNKNTIVIPTSVNMDRYLERPGGGDTVTIGWIGSRVTLHYLERLQPVFDRIFDKFPETRLKIVSNAFFDCRRMPVIKKEWTQREEIADLHSFDIGLMPLIDDPWSRGKCGFKLLQYMAVGVPAVCSPVGVNSEIVEGGRNGYFAKDESEWELLLGRLISDAPLRKGLGLRARKTVTDRYSTEVNGPLLLKLLLRTGGQQSGGTSSPT